MPSRSELAAIEAIDRWLDSDFGRTLADLPAQQEAADTTEAPSVPSGPPSTEPAASLLREELIEPPHDDWSGYDDYITDSGREGGG